MKIKRSLALLFFTVAQVLAFCAQDNKRIEEIKMEMINGLPYMQAEINGKGPFLFGFDSGMGGDIQLDSTLAVTLGLKPTGSIEAGDPSGKNNVTLSTTNVAEVKIGSTKFTGLTATLYNRRAMPGMKNVSGIIGITLFKDYIITLDYPSFKFYLEQGRLKANNREVLSYKPYGGGVPGIKIKVGNHTITALVDTRNMSGEFKIPQSLTGKLHFVSAPRVIGQGRTISNTVSINEATLQESIQLGSYEFKTPVVTYPSFSEEGLIGARLLRKFILSIDAKSRTIRFLKSEKEPAAEAPVPVRLTAADSALLEYAGKYGEREITVENGSLHIQRPHGMKLKMLPVKKDEFTIENIAKAKILFERDKNGKIVIIRSLQPDGEWQSFERIF